MKRIIAACIIVGFASFSSIASAENIVQNDSFGESFTGNIQSADIIDGEMYEASFEIPDSWFDISPTGEVEILGARVVMLDGPNPGRNCGRFSVEIWSESTAAPATGNGCYFDTIRDRAPGTQIFSLEQLTNGLGFEVAANPNAFQDLRFSAISNNPQLMVTIPPIMITRENRFIRLGLKALDKQCTQAGANYPVMLTDNDRAVPLKNFLYGASTDGLCPNTNHYLWEDFAPFFPSGNNQIPGDFVIRLIVERGDGTPPVDMGMGDDMSSSDMGNTSDDSGSGGDDMSTTEDDSGNGNGGDDQGNSAALNVESVSPDSGPADASTEIVIIGTGFQQGASVLVGAEAIGVVETKSELIRATIPEGFDVGVYDVIVSNPNGESDSLADAFTVLAAEQEREASEGGCCATHGTTHGSTALLAFLLFGVAFVRRKLT